MSWKGFALGAFLAQLFTGGRGGALASILGGALGVAAEAKFKKMQKGTEQPSYSRQRTAHGASSVNRELVFCACAAAMLAKIAKADGHITATEIRAVERSFARLGFSVRSREYAVNVFRKAKDDSHTIYEYAHEFASAVPSVEVRELLYRLLWELAAADGEVGAEELALLRGLPKPLGINPHWFNIHSWDFRHVTGDDSSDSGSRSRSRGADINSLAAAYKLLGVASTASDDEVKRAYRDKAKRYHPDVLRAQGLPDSMIEQANEQMAKINAAWSQIKSARGL